MAHSVANPSQTNRIFYDRYLQALTSHQQQAIQKVAVAVGYVLTDDDQMNGSALAVNRDLILVPKHCFPFNNGRIFFEYLHNVIEAQTYLDGENDPPPEFRSDFKILKIKGKGLRPAPLSVDSSIGEGVQLNFRLDCNFYALPYETVESEGGYATRSDLVDEITANGDSGGARYSWLSKGVSGIHQGQSEALTINQIYHVVAAIFQRSQMLEVRQRALEVLKALDENIVDKSMLIMHSSTVYLQPGQVIPERHGLFQSRVITSETIPAIPVATINQIYQYLDLINKEPEKKLDFSAEYEERQIIFTAFLILEIKWLELTDKFEDVMHQTFRYKLASIQSQRF